jgi:hypothetical protein
MSSRSVPGPSLMDCGIYEGLACESVDLMGEDFVSVVQVYA